MHKNIQSHFLNTKTSERKLKRSLGNGGCSCGECSGRNNRGHQNCYL